MNAQLARLLGFAAAMSVSLGTMLVVPVAATAGTGDKTDQVAWFRPGDSSFHHSYALPAGAPQLEYRSGPMGDLTILPIVGDWDGNGTATAGWFRPSDSSWHLTNSSTGGTSSYAFVFGPAAGDPTIKPIAGDWDGDGKDSIGWYRPSDSSFHLTNTLSNAAGWAFKTGPDGDPTLLPVAGDWNGDGADTVGWFRPSDSSWHLTDSNENDSDYSYVYGPTAGDATLRPVVGDWNNDGVTTAGWYRPSDASWHLTNSHYPTSTTMSFVYGTPGDTTIWPVAGDWDGYTPPPPPPPPALPTGATLAINYATAQIGKPYGFGDEGPDSFDCSGLTMMSMRAAGVSMPRTAHSQYLAYGGTIPLSQRKPGDLLFYNDGGNTRITHVALYIGNDQMIEAPRPQSPVRKVSLRTYKILPTVGRPLG